MSPALVQRRWVQWGLICACWTFIAFFYTTQAGSQATYAGAPFDWWRVFRAELVYSSLWVALTLAIIRIDDRFPLDTGSWRRNCLVHLGVSVLVAALHPLVMVEALRLLGWSRTSRPFWDVSKLSVVSYFHVNLTFYWGIIGVRYILSNYHKYRERELTASNLETKLAQSQLQVLKMQLHPHFLFNTLNSISVLMAEDREAANRTLVRLSDLLRMTLDNDGAQEVPLKQELDFLQGYLDIERTRFHDRLTIRVNVELSALDAQVPNLLLQPLVENAIRHGISPHARPGLVEISARREGETLCVEVRDNGGGLAEAGPEPSARGVGITTTRARLEQLYGSGHRFEMRNGPEGGAWVKVVIPFRTGHDA
jgi:two-component system LytT family sensor kinase